VSARFTANFVVLITGAGLLVALFAFSFDSAHWIALGVGVTASVMALMSFATPHQGVYQRTADVVICALGVWAVVAAVVMNDRSIWLVFGAGAGLAVLGAIGLLIRELELGRVLKVGSTHNGTGDLAPESVVQREREVSR
jgi:hypothetical protein